MLGPFLEQRDDQPSPVPRKAKKMEAGKLGVYSAVLHSRSLTGFIERPTEDLDVVALVDSTDMVSADPLPDNLVAAAKEVANLYGLRVDWLNPGPASVADQEAP